MWPTHNHGIITMEVICLSTLHMVVCNTTSGFLMGSTGCLRSFHTLRVGKQIRRWYLELSRAADFVSLTISNVWVNRFLMSEIKGTIDTIIALGTNCTIIWNIIVISMVHMFGIWMVSSHNFTTGKVWMGTEVVPICIFGGIATKIWPFE